MHFRMEGGDKNFQPPFFLPKKWRTKPSAVAEGYGVTSKASLHCAVRHNFTSSRGDSRSSLKRRSFFFTSSQKQRSLACLSRHETIVSNQIGRAGTSIGANILEAQYAHGKADFIAKLQIALKEADETRY